MRRPRPRLLTSGAREALGAIGLFLIGGGTLLALFNFN